jgi:hypothetical protein
MDVLPDIGYLGISSRPRCLAPVSRTWLLSTYSFNVWGFPRLDSVLLWTPRAITDRLSCVLNSWERAYLREDLCRTRCLCALSTFLLYPYHLQL